MPGTLPTHAACRSLRETDRGAVEAFLARDPVAGALISGRLGGRGLDPGDLGGELWGYGDGDLTGLCLAAAILVPLTDDPAALAAFADRAGGTRRGCSSIVGPRVAVDAVWSRLEPEWGPAREYRDDQPLLVLAGRPVIDPDPTVRRVTRTELDALFPASVAMFTEEIGVSPLGADRGRTYRSHVRRLIDEGRAFARFDEHGEVVFKAELGVLTPEVVQIQGVWVAPPHRGRGLAAPGVAAVVAATVPRSARTASLYVNGHNTAALRAYRRVGFTQVGTFATVLF